MAELKTFKVILSENLPNILERDPNTIYFIYDKLMIFWGQNIYKDPYAIVESIPENPVTGMMYIVTDGTVKAYIDYSIKDIAFIETDEEVEILKQTGTTFFINAEQRYLDLRRRIITLPYQNGTYELTVSAANNLKIDATTVIAFNPKTNRFDIVGKRQDYDLVFTSKYRGAESNSITMDVSEHRVSGEVKINPSEDNMIKLLPDGLYASVDDVLDKRDFDEWSRSFSAYKAAIDVYLKDLEDQIKDSQVTISETTITKRIESAIKDAYPNIAATVEKFDELYDQMNNIESNVKKYADNRFSAVYRDITNTIIASLMEIWEDF